MLYVGQQLWYRHKRYGIIGFVTVYKLLDNGFFQITYRGKHYRLSPSSIGTRLFLSEADAINNGHSQIASCADCRHRANGSCSSIGSSPCSDFVFGIPYFDGLYD